MAAIIPLPRNPLQAPRPDPLPQDSSADTLGGDPVARWYAHALGWATTSAVCGPPAGPSVPRQGCADQTPQTRERWPQLLTGLRFDVLELPAEAGCAVLRRLPDRAPTGPVSVGGGTMRLFVAAGSAEELPGLLDWLEWGRLPADLTAAGAGGSIPAPLPPGWSGPRGGAVWLRPPEPGRDTEPTLPALAGLGSRRAVPGDDHTEGPDLVRLVDLAATECHRLRLHRGSGQPLAFSYASRIEAGTRPRSLTS
ncbi:hypothetical protein DSC45_25390 [Streptomyces sp. YIM 130001]|uniref:SCO3374 family protein n=1 Tax=Streptomyces sp. YIM 130001 TaxID=2259644 RepID=UPI000E64C661|nr:SCO3374 family protein [Streptomyces sp. YIM 130001]RII12484.1 hypothetical protein DSC45_25390 [Streptomyces sp. YIM 130001]